MLAIRDQGRPQREGDTQAKTQRGGGGKATTWLPGCRTFQAEETRTKALRQECSWCVRNSEAYETEQGGDAGVVGGIRREEARQSRTWSILGCPEVLPGVRPRESQEGWSRGGQNLASVLTDGSVCWVESEPKRGQGRSGESSQEVAAILLVVAGSREEQLESRNILKVEPR